MGDGMRGEIFVFYDTIKERFDNHPKPKKKKKKKKHKKGK